MGNICYNNVMNRVVSFLQHYLVIIAVLIGISILLSVTFSNFIVTSNNHKAAEMYIGELKYSIEIDGSSNNTLTVPTGETIIDVKVNNLNPVDTYYKLLYLKNTNITVKYYESTKDTNDVVTTYNKPNDSITSSNLNTIKLLITNNSTSSQNIALTMRGGYITNTIQDITTPSTYSEITLVETPSTNTYFCKTNNTLTWGLKYINGQYTYAYKVEGYYSNDSSKLAWFGGSPSVIGWGVQLTDKVSTDAVTSKLCTYINNKPITSMSYMFYKSQAMTLDLSSFDTSKVTNMGSMFQRSQATALDLSNFNTSKVTNMGEMFYQSQATTIDVSNFNTSNVTDMSYMFEDTKATIIDVSGFNTSNVIKMNEMFRSSASTILNVSNFDTSNVTDMNHMFNFTEATTIDVSNFDTSKVTDMSNMFADSKATTIDVSNFNTSNVINMHGMFYESQATTLDVSNFDTSKVTNMAYMFSNSEATFLDVSNFDTSNVKAMNVMFQLTKVKTLDLSNFDTSNVTNMSYMFGYSPNLVTIYVSDKFNTSNVTDSTNMFTSSSKIIGGAGTKYNSSYVDKTYAHIDGGTSNPGYFTDVVDKDIPAPNAFATDSWKTIIKAVRNNNISKYHVGDTRTIDVGTYGTHTLRIANTSTPSECSRTGFSQTACGFVLEFADIITEHNMNDKYTNVGGWPASDMRTFVNNDIYNSLPSDLKNGIIDTTVISSYGSSDSSNFTSIDKLYLLAPKEIYSDFNLNYDTAKDLTRQLDYYKNEGVTNSNYSKVIKMYNSTTDGWCLRSAYSSSNNIFYYVFIEGYLSNSAAYGTHGVSPAFRIG